MNQKKIILFLGAAVIFGFAATKFLVADSHNFPPYITEFSLSGVADGRTKITVGFNKPIDPATVSSDTAYITPENISSLKLDRTFEKSTSSFALLTNVGLSTNNTYVMTVREEIKDLDGNKMSAAFVCKFTWTGYSFTGCPTGLPAKPSPLPDPTPSPSPSPTPSPSPLPSPSPTPTPTPTSTPPAFEKNLFFGMTNDEDVKALQELFTKLGLYSGPTNGNFFNLTRQAVSLFQQQNGIPAVGRVGPQTRTKLNELANSTQEGKPVLPPVQAVEINILRDLSSGSRGEDVRALQELLLREGVYPQGLITGFFGELTKQAVIRFQEKYASEILAPVGLTKGTGYVGPSTRAKLNSLQQP